MTAEPAGRGALTERAMRREARDLDLFAACFAKNSDRPRSLESLRWQYFDNPTNRLFVDMALTEDETRIAAIYATLPGRMRVRGQGVRLAAQSLDTLTDVDFRGRGLFVRLAQKTYARLAASQAALVYGFPNGSSAPGFFRKLGWENLDPVPFLVRPLRTRYFAGRVPGYAGTLLRWLPDLPLRAPATPRFGAGVRLVHDPVLDGAVDELWREFREDLGIVLDRSAAYLRWRVVEKPEERYRRIAIRDEQGLAALCIFTVKDKHGGRIGYVMELLHRRSSARAAAKLLACAVREMAADGADAVLAWCFPHSPNHRAYLRNAFVPLPERFRPIELHFGARAFDDRLAPLVGDRSQWYLSYLDSDTV